MIAIAAPHRGKNATMAEMARMVRDYPEDLRRFRGIDLRALFESVRKIPYGEDLFLYGNGDAELVARPRFLLDRRLFPRLDCKKKAILMASWAEENGIPWRFVAVCENGSGDAHHVFTQMQFADEWRNVDPTFPNFRLFEPKPHVTHAWEFSP